MRRWAAGCVGLGEPLGSVGLWGRCPGAGVPPGVGDCGEAVRSRGAQEQVRP